MEVLVFLHDYMQGRGNLLKRWFLWMIILIITPYIGFDSHAKAAINGSVIFNCDSLLIENASKINQQSMINRDSLNVDTLASKKSLKKNKKNAPVRRFEGMGVELFKSPNIRRETKLFSTVQPDLTEPDMLDILDSQPAFGVFRDFYIVSGIPLNKSANRNNTDVLIQLSIRQRLTQSRLPWNFFLYFSYTQKSFWNAYAKSGPFDGHVFNPALGFGKYLIKDNKLKGILAIQIEHESNGKDGNESRSWNLISITGRYIFNPRLSVSARVWIPWVDGKNNKGLLRYRGVGAVMVDILSKNEKWWFSAELNPRMGFGNFNTTLTASLKLSPKHNQYLFLRFFDGRGENLYYYKRYDINLRIGVCIKPDFFMRY